MHTQRIGGLEEEEPGDPTASNGCLPATTDPCARVSMRALKRGRMGLSATETYTMMHDAVSKEGRKEGLTKKVERTSWSLF